MTSPKFYLNGDDPLSREAASFLIGYKEEDGLVDFKETFHHDEERAWLDLTIDVSALANTHGGYIVFGVEDVAKRIVGINKAVAEALRDSNNVLQKINRHLEPHITGVRSKVYRFDGKSVCLLYVPQSLNKTHVISKDGAVRYPSGKTKTRLRKGTIYVRRSGGNHLVDSRDLDDLVERRIDHFRAALLDKVAQVVNTPATSEVFVVSRDPEDDSAERFVIEDSPDSIPVKGMSFTVSPEGPEQEIAAWSVLCRGDSSQIPPENVIWGWYRDREKIGIRKAHKLTLFQFSLWRDVPAFYWIRGLKNADIGAALLYAIRKRRASASVKQMLVVSSFLGKSTYKSALTALGEAVSRVAPAMQTFPTNGPRAAFGTIQRPPKQSTRQLVKALTKELDQISEKPKKTGRPVGLQNKWRAHTLDCFLYAQDDRYK